MKHSVLSFLILLCLTGAVACRPHVKKPAVNPKLVERELEYQKEMALKLELERRQRVYRVSSAITVAAKDLCGDRVKPLHGILVADPSTIPEDFRTAAARLGFAGDQLTVSFVAPGLPAATAGLKRGDVITKINGVDLTNPPKPASAHSKKESRGDLFFRLAREAGTNPLTVEIERPEGPLTLTITPVEACDYAAYDVPGDALNAATDGKTIVVTQGMLRFVKSDDELAVVLGHELAHAIMGHLNETKPLRIVAGAFGLLADAGLAVVGIYTGGALTRAAMGAGSRVFSKEYEREADYIGLYLAARAGYDVSDAADLFRRMGIEHPSSMQAGFLATHPSTPERVAAIRETVKEIEMKVARGEPLVPKAEAETDPQLEHAALEKDTE